MGWGEEEIRKRYLYERKRRGFNTAHRLVVLILVYCWFLVDAQARSFIRCSWIRHVVHVVVPRAWGPRTSTGGCGCCPSVGRAAVVGIAILLVLQARGQSTSTAKLLVAVLAIFVSFWLLKRGYIRFGTSLYRVRGRVKRILAPIAAGGKTPN